MGGEILESEFAISFNKNGTSKKDAILLTLFREWPLTATKIYYKLKRNGDGITYQGVHKHLTDLSSQGVLTKIYGKYYLISWEWLKWITYNATNLKQQYKEFSLKHNVEFFQQENLFKNF